ncbi:hypothetical protein ACOMHN_034475 [Nucella lapillus]
MRYSRDQLLEIQPSTPNFELVNRLRELRLGVGLPRKRGCRGGRKKLRSIQVVPSCNLHPLMVPPFLQPHQNLQSAVGNAPLSSKHPTQLPTTDCLLSIIPLMGGQPSDAPALSPPSPLQQGGQSSNAPALSPPSPLPQGGQPIALALSPLSPPPQDGQPSDAPGLSPSSSTLLLCPSDSTLSICHLNSQSAVKTGMVVNLFRKKASSSSSSGLATFSPTQDRRPIENGSQALDKRSLELLFSLPFLSLPWKAVSDVDSMIKTMTDHCLAAAEQATFKWRGWWDQLSDEEKFLPGNLDQFCHFSGQDQADREYKEHWTEHLRTILTFVKKIWEQKRLRNLQDWRSVRWSGRRLVVKLEVLPVPLQGQVAIRHVVLQSLRMVMPVTLHFSGLDFSPKNDIWRNARGVEFWRFYEWKNALWYQSFVSQHATDRPAVMITPCDGHRREFYQDLGRNFRFYQSILDCQDVEMLTALSLKGLGYEEMRQLMPSLSKFHNLQALELSHCASALKQEHSGCAFCRIYTQAADTNFQRRSEFFASFQYLVRLDLNQSDLTDCLGEILVALPTPLQYLVLNRCHLSCGDLEALAGSKHVASLLEVDLSCVRGGWYIEEYWTQGFAEAVLKVVASMPRVQIVNMASFKANPVNGLPPVEIGGVVKSSLKDLKVLILSNDTFILEELAELCQSLSCIQTFQKVIFKFSFLVTDDLTTTQAEEALFQHFAKHGRSDVAVQISSP